MNIVKKVWQTDGQTDGMNQAMIRWMCGVTTKDQVSSQDILERMQLDDLAKVFWTLRQGWHGHAKRNDCWWKNDRLAFSLRPTFSTGKLGVVHLEVPSDWNHPYSRE